MGSRELQFKIYSNNINKIKAGEFLDLNIIPYDDYSQCFNGPNLSNLFEVIVVGPSGKQKFNFEKVKGTECEYIYKIMLDESNNYVKAGTYSIVIYYDGKTFANYTQTVVSGDIDEDKYVVYYTDMDKKSYTDQTIPVGETIHFLVQAYDKFSNKIDGLLSPDLFEINVTPTIDENTISKGDNGTLSCLFNTTKIGTYYFEYLYNKKIINPNKDKGPKQITYIAGSFNINNSLIILLSGIEINISRIYNYTIRCFDKYGNQIDKGGANFTSEIWLYSIKSQTKTKIEPKIEYKENSTYVVSFNLTLIGKYLISIIVDGNKYNELEYTYSCNNYICPNIGKCVDDLRECIPIESQCQNETEKEKKTI